MKGLVHSVGWLRQLLQHMHAPWQQAASIWRQMSSSPRLWLWLDCGCGFLYVAPLLPTSALPTGMALCAQYVYRLRSALIPVA
jgi:hypothetical protein